MEQDRMASAQDRMPRERARKIVKAAGPIYVVIALVAAWEIAVVVLHPEPVLFPGPWPVARAFYENIRNGSLLSALRYSLVLILEGFGLGLVGASLLALLALFSTVGRVVMETLVGLFNPLPAVALVPLALLWFGLGTSPVIFVIVMAVIWPATINIFTGFATVSPTLRRVGANFGLKGVRLLGSLLIPAALPNILGGVRISWAFAWRTAIAAELVFGVSGQHGGLGFFIYNARYFLETSTMFGGLIMIMIIGIVVEGIFRIVESQTTRKWGTST